MSPQKRFAFVAAVAALTIGWAATSHAQVIVPYGYPPPYRYAYGEPLASVRLDVTPKEAEVYVDGYYAGIVDDFDGIFQRLHVAAGAHAITLYRDGYRSATQQVYLPPYDTFKIRYRMEPLAPGQTAEARPLPQNPPEPPVQAGGPRPFPGRRGPFPPYGPPPPDAPPQPNQPGVPYPPPPPDRPAGAQPPPQSGVGMIALHLQPADAEVFIDGQIVQVPAGQDRLVIDASEGPHAVQIRKPGYVGYLTNVTVRRNETAMLDVNLRRQP